MSKMGCVANQQSQHQDFDKHLLEKPQIIRKRCLKKNDIECMSLV